MQGKWIFTFNDMITLLLTFFVLVLSMAHIETAKVKGVSQAVRKMVGKEGETGRPFSVIDSFIPSLQDEDIEKARLAQLRRKMPEVASLYKVLRRLEGLKVTPRERGFLLTLPETVFFTPGDAELTKSGRRTLLALGKVLSQIPPFIRVEGHTDDLPIKSERFPSNWELSLARAVSVVKFLIAETGIQPERLSAAGYAETRPRVDNRDAASRQLNRRVELVLTFP